MEPESLGRKLGIGVRVAARMVGERATQAAQSSQTQAPKLAQATLQQTTNQPTTNQKTMKVAEKTRAVTRASKRFGEAIWGPIAHVGGVLWLEITGLFFALFTLFFAQSVYRLRSALHSGADHQRFLVYAALTLIFAYFTISSFYRARRKERKKKR